MSQHTPGPWEVDGLAQRHDADRSIMARTKSGNLRPVARAYGEGVLAGASLERKVNARLIAAAPEMYALLQSAVSCWGFVATDMSHGANERNAAKVARDEARALFATIDRGTEE